MQPTGHLHVGAGVGGRAFRQESRQQGAPNPRLEGRRPEAERRPGDPPEWRWESRLPGAWGRQAHLAGPAGSAGNSMTCRSHLAREKGSVSQHVEAAQGPPCPAQPAGGAGPSLALRHQTHSTGDASLEPTQGGGSGTRALGAWERAEEGAWAGRPRGTQHGRPVPPPPLLPSWHAPSSPLCKCHPPRHQAHLHTAALCPHRHSSQTDGHAPTLPPTSTRVLAHTQTHADTICTQRNTGRHTTPTCTDTPDTLLTPRNTHVAPHTGTWHAHIPKACSHPDTPQTHAHVPGQGPGHLLLRHSRGWCGEGVGDGCPRIRHHAQLCPQPRELPKPWVSDLRTDPSSEAPAMAFEDQETMATPLPQARRSPARSTEAGEAQGQAGHHRP